MRIDRIRITSLASLHGVQPAVDFAGPILGQAGLVAITGPTGSGKSTLLDGLSLAIFGCTPRLGKDTDHLLSRDATEGGTEVTFTLDDGSQWIASWYVHRSRKQLEGTVQTPTHQIARVSDGKIDATGAKEVKAWVEKNLRLTFDQFRGVMLLAQFDFARFLVADDKDRSLLLEKLTGTDLYAKLSAAAFEQCKVAQERVQQHQLVLAGLKPLSPEERTAIEAAIATGVVTSTAAEATWSAAQVIVTWWTERRRLLDDQTQRQRAAADAGRLWQEAEPQRQRLTAAESALQLQTELTRVDESRLQVTKSRQLLSTSTDVQLRAITELQRREQELAHTAAQLAAATRAAESAASAVTKLAQVPDEALQPAREALVQLRERTRQLDEVRQLRERKQTAVGAAVTAAAVALGAQQTAGHLRATAAATLATAETARTTILAGCDPAALGEQVALASEAGLVAKVLTQLDVTGATAAQAQSTAQLVTVEAHAVEADKAAVLAVRQFELAELQKQRAESLAGIADFVHLLENGQSCPLCGAAEHPHPAVAGSTLVAEAQAHLALATKQRKTAEAAAKQATVAVNTARAGLAQLTVTLERVTTEWQQRHERWSALVTRLPGLSAQPDLAATEALATSLTGRLAAARQAESLYTAANDGLRNAEVALADSDRRLAIAQAQHQQAEAALAECVASVTATEAGLVTAQAAVSSAVAELAVQLEEPIPVVAALWLDGLPTRLSAARKLVDQARQLREADDDLGALARRRLPAGSVSELPSTVVLDPRVPIKALRQSADTHQAALTSADQAKQAVLAAQQAVDTAGVAVIEHETLLAERLATTDFPDEATLRAALLPQRDLHDLRQRIQQLQQAATSTQGEAERAVQALASQVVPADLDAADPAGAATAEAALATAQDQRDRERDQLQRDRQSLTDDDHRNQERARIEAEAGPLLAAAQQAATLSELIGSRDGARFRRFAQALTLDQLVVLANHRLTALAPRYQMMRTHAVIGQDPSLGLEIIDLEQAEAQRPVATLSGGETFLVSLALALALADLKRGGLRLGTLFIDEGFGSLDPATLERCLAILERLQQEQGTQIVVISHVGALHERLAHRIEVRPQGNGRSRLRISGPEGVSEDSPPAAVAPAVVAARTPVTVTISEATLATLYDALPEDGRAESSRNVRKQLGWDEATFKSAVTLLMDAGRIEQPTGTRSLRRRIPGTP